jgi:hypothetical protein
MAFPPESDFVQINESRRTVLNHSSVLGAIGVALLQKALKRIKGGSHRAGASGVACGLFALAHRQLHQPR